MTHPPHPPSEMVRAVALVLEESPVPSSDEEQRALAEKVIRTMFAHVDRKAMLRAMYEAYRVHKIAPDVYRDVDWDDLLRWAADGKDVAQLFVDCGEKEVDAALAAALDAALPGHGVAKPGGG